MRDVIARIVDGSRFREFKKEYGPTMLTVRLDLFLFFCCYSSKHIVGLCTHPWLRSGYLREQRDLVLSFGAQGDTFHRVVLATTDSPPILSQCHRLHGRIQGGKGRYRERRCKDGSRRRMCGRTEVDSDRWRELRSGQLR